MLQVAIKSRPFLYITVTCLLFSGCAGGRMQQNYSALSQEDLQSAGARLEKNYNQNPNDKYAALEYARILKASGAQQQALGVIQPVATQNQDDADIQAEFGKILAANNQLPSALMALNTAGQINPRDWRIQSARGAVLDQMGQLQESRAAYEQALAIQPNEPSVLSNLALSYALTKDLPKASALAQQAANHPKADSRVRQNLALITGLNGNMPEAERILKAELPADEASQTIAALRGMLKQPNSWSQLKKGQKLSTSMLAKASTDANLETASLPTQVDEYGTPITPSSKAEAPRVIKAPTWDMLMDKPSIKGKAVE